MLINSIKKTYRELTGQFELAGPVVAIPDTLPAANASRLSNTEIQARRLRRQRRMERASKRGFIGWTVRTW